MLLKAEINNGPCHEILDLFENNFYLSTLFDGISYKHVDQVLIIIPILEGRVD
jgi:hypothetical protein